ncbi:hypothetical protein AAC387_Pa03g0795 [Persea americana]
MAARCAVFCCKEKEFHLFFKCPFSSSRVCLCVFPWKRKRHFVPYGAGLSLSLALLCPLPSPSPLIWFSISAVSNGRPLCSFTSSLSYGVAGMNLSSMENLTSLSPKRHLTEQLSKAMGWSSSGVKRPSRDAIIFWVIEV